MGWENRCCISQIIFVLLLGTCQADTGLEEFLDFVGDSNQITNIEDIEYIESQFKPDQTVQSHKHIRGWVDIIGYKNTTYEDGIFYSNGGDAIIQYEVWDAGLYWNNNFDWIKIEDVRTTTEGNMTTAEIDIHLMWHRSTKKCRTVTHKDGGSHTYCWIKKDYYHEKTTFSTTDITPAQYPNVTLQNHSIIIFNNSFAPKTIIELHENNYMLGYRVEYCNESIEYYYNILDVEQNENNFPYGNVTKIESNPIYEDSNMFSRVGNKILLNSTNTDEMNNSLKLFIITPYKEQEINCSIVNGSKKHGIEGATISNVFSLVILCWIVVYLIRYFRH